MQAPRHETKQPELSNDGRRSSAYVDFLFRWRWLVLVLTFSVALAAASGARFIEFDTDYRYFFREDNPQLHAFEDLQEIYAKNDITILVVAPESGRVFSPETLSAVSELTERAWQLPFTTRVDSITNFQHSRGEEDDLIVEDLVDLSRPLGVQELEELESIAQAEPVLRRRLISGDSKVTAIYTRSSLPGEEARRGSASSHRDPQARGGYRESVSRPRGLHDRGSGVHARVSRSVDPGSLNADSDHVPRYPGDSDRLPTIFLGNVDHDCDHRVVSKLGDRHRLLVRPPGHRSELGRAHADHDPSGG